MSEFEVGDRVVVLEHQNEISPTEPCGCVYVGQCGLVEEIKSARYYVRFDSASFSYRRGFAAEQLALAPEEVEPDPKATDIEAWWVAGGDGRPVFIEVAYDEDNASMSLVIDDEPVMTKDLLEGSFTEAVNVWVQQ